MSYPPSEAVSKTLIIGADGFLGKAFQKAYKKIHGLSFGTSRSLNAQSKGLLYLDLENLNLLKLRKDLSELKKNGVEQALILAAVTSVDACEKDPQRSTLINVKNTLALIKELFIQGLKPIFASSDYVFDGNSGNSSESDQPNPQTVYGRHKLAVEEGIAALAGQLKKEQNDYLILRLSKVFSLEKTSQCLLGEMANQLSKGNTIRAAVDQRFCPILREDLLNAYFKLQAKEKSLIGGILHLCSPESWLRYDLACRLAENLGIHPHKIKNQVKKISISEVSPNRPRDTTMSIERLQSLIAFQFTPIQTSLKELSLNFSSFEK